MLDPTEPSQTAVQAFITKLWHMVSDSASDNLITWGKDGTTFIIKDHNKFSSELLPMYYKHNNMASFIRQLNMYNFHKVLLVSSSSLNNQKELAFSHPNFIKDQPRLLTKIQRKIHSKELSEIKCDPVVLNNLLMEVKQLRAIHEVFANKLNVMKKENAALWREHSILRQRHTKQEKIVNKVIHFLISMVQQSSINVTRRKVPLMIKDRPILKAHKKKYVRVVNPKTQPVISEMSTQGTLDDPNQQTVKAEEMLPEDFILSCNESDDEEEIPTVSGTSYQHTMSNLQPQIKLEVPNSIDELEQQRHVHLKNRTAKKRRFEEIKSSNSLQPDFDETHTLSPASSFAESVQSPEFLLMDSNDDITQLLQAGEVEKTPATPKGNGIYTQAMSNLQQSRTNNAQTQAIDNNQVLNDSTVLQNVPETSQNYILVTSPIPIVSTPPQNVSAETSFNNLNENSTIPSKKTLLQLAKPTDIPENMNTKESVELHLDKVQSDLDILKDLLKGEGISLDTNMIFELFNENPMDLNMGRAGQSTSPQMFQDPSASKQALISYTPSLLDFDTELSMEPEVIPQIDDEIPIDYALNTPQIRIQSPTYPDPS